MSEAIPAPVTAAPRGRGVRGRLFRKYVGLFVAVVCVALFANGLFEIWFSYQEHKTALIRIQREQAEAAAAKIGQFVKEIEGQLGWTVQLPWSASTLEQRRFDALRLLRQVPAITELSQLDSTGKEQLRVSRLAMDVVGSGLDLSKDPKFAETVARKVYYGPVYFRREVRALHDARRRRYPARRRRQRRRGQPQAHLGRDLADQGRPARARLCGRIAGAAHRPPRHQPRPAQHRPVAACRRSRRQATPPTATSCRRRATRKGARCSPPTPASRRCAGSSSSSCRSRRPMRRSTTRSSAPACCCFGALFLAALAGMFLARRMVVPIQALREGAERIGRGELAQRISVKTGDELEALADQFNDMAGKLEESYAGLERKVERAHAGADRIPDAADRDRRRAQGHQPFDVRPAAGAGHAGRIGGAPVPGGDRLHLPSRRRTVSPCREPWLLARVRGFRQGASDLARSRHPRRTRRGRGRDRAHPGCAGGSGIHLARGPGAGRHAHHARRPASETGNADRRPAGHAPRRQGVHATSRSSSSPPSPTRP